jgi:prolyl-tRNA synthetase
MVKEGYLSLDGKQKLIEKKGIEVGNIFQLGYHYTNKMKGAIYTDDKGQESPFYMGCYGIGVGRTMAAIVEKYHDDRGITWPGSVAPFAVHLIELGRDKKVKATAEKIYQDLQKQNVKVLYDNREDKSAGEKFAESDLIGIPLRVVVSEKTVAKNSVEIKERAKSVVKIVKIKDLKKIVNYVYNLQ